MANKERQDGNSRVIIKHGPDKGMVDLSIKPPEVQTTQGGKVDITGLLQEVRGQRLPSHPRKHRHKHSR